MFTVQSYEYDLVMSRRVVLEALLEILFTVFLKERPNVGVSYTDNAAAPFV